MKKSKRRTFKIHELPPYIQEQILADPRFSTANNQPSAGDESANPDPVQKADPPSCFQGPVRMRLHHKRKSTREADRGQLWDKWLIDALVVAGVLSEDNPTVLPEEPKQTYEVQKREEVEIEIVPIKPCKKLAKSL